MVSLAGGCPNVAIMVRLMTIVVDRSTHIRGGNCDDLRLGRRVEGSGTTQPNGTIKATDLRVRKEDDDD